MLNIANHQGNANQKSQWDIISYLSIWLTSYLSVWLTSKRTPITNAGKNVEEREHSYITSGNVIGTATVENNMEFSPKTKDRNIIWSAVPPLGIYLKTKQSTNLKRYMHPNVHSSIVYNYQVMEATYVCLSICLSLSLYIYKHNGILIRHKKEGLPFMATWMNLEGINKSDRETNTACVEPKKYSKLIYRT